MSALGVLASGNSTERKKAAGTRMAAMGIRHFGTPDADQRKGVRQQATRCKIVERGNEQPMHEVPAGAEHHQAAWICLLDRARGLSAGHALSSMRLDPCDLASLCPPKPCRVGESTFWAKVCSS